MVGTAFAPHALCLAAAAAAFAPSLPPPSNPDTALVAPAATAAATAAPVGPRATGSAAPLDFTPLVQTLARVIACAPLGTIPDRFDAQVIEAHCKQLGALANKWRDAWLTQALPFLSAVVPRDLPPTVVYPFGGGDLLTALVTFPSATEITTLSLEPAGDPRTIDSLLPAELDPMLGEVREKVNHLFHYGHSKTVDMGKLAKSKLPGDLTYTLVALEMYQLDPVSVRFFRVNPEGGLVYLTQDDLAEPADPAVSPSAGAGQSAQPAVQKRDPKAPVPPTSAFRRPFANMEIQFVPRGGGPRRTFRHIAANLDDKHLIADPAVLRHLEAKGPVAAITKAASYLLWWKEFGQIRGYLLNNMVWMISDSTGVPPDEAAASGFEQIPYGRFDGPFLGGGIRPAEVFRKMWADKAQPLAFRFGYPDVGNHDHLLITRRLPK